MTGALEGGVWSVARTDRILPPGKSRYPFYRKLGGPQFRSGRAENLVPTSDRPARSYTDWATRPTSQTIITSNIIWTYRNKIREKY